MADPVFVDGVTDLNAVNLNKLQTRDEKAAANGYPSLDGTGKVPAAQLPALGSAIEYVGAYDAARTYHDGEYVVGPDGVTYQCVIEGTHGVTPTPWSPWSVPVPPVVNGQWLKGVGGAAVWSALADSDISTAAPRLQPYNYVVADCNTMVNNGWYRALNAANGPPSSTGHAMIHVVALDSAGNCRQVAYDYSTDAAWVRRHTNGLWGNWILHQPIVGVIDGNGGITAGGGFTCAHPSTGLYNVTLNPSVVQGYPVMVVTPSSTSVCAAVQIASSTLLSVYFTTPAVYVDSGFSFVCYSTG